MKERIPPHRSCQREVPLTRLSAMLKPTKSSRYPYTTQLIAPGLQSPSSPTYIDTYHQNSKHRHPNCNVEIRPLILDNETGCSQIVGQDDGIREEVVPSRGKTVNLGQVNDLSHGALAYLYMSLPSLFIIGVKHHLTYPRAGST